MRANSDELDEKAKPVVQLKGRFKVTSDNVDVEKVITQHPIGPLPSPSDAVPANLHSFFSNVAVCSRNKYS